jgi:DNA-binding SARP family transcriptional activator
MRFKVLGALEVEHNGRLYTPTAPKVRWVLALLLVRANHVVSVDSLISGLWGERPPRSAITTAQTYIYQLRQMFRRVLGEAAADELLSTRPPGYVLRLDDDWDVPVFTRLMTQGRTALDAGDPATASRMLSGALALWRGSALINVGVSGALEAHVAHLEEMRLRALELRIQADVELGRQRELIPELRSLVAQHPLNESMHGHLISALNSSGRRGEALQAYQSARRILLDELGLEPSPQLQQLQYELLSAGSESRSPRQLVGAGAVRA